MKPVPFSSAFARGRSHSAAALIIVLAFLVLLVGLVLAFFSRAILNRQISDASAHQTKVDILAHSVVDLLVGDFKEEIRKGSRAVSAAGRTFYLPLQPENMVPARSGVPTPDDPLDNPMPNLIRRSVRDDALAQPAPGYIGTAACAVNSADDPSANGRSVSRARWNAHYLLPRAHAGSATIDTTPVADFTPPDWVMLTDSGPTLPTSPDAAITGRYAYAIYDEGGLLDANAVGYPPGLESRPTAATSPVALKGAVGFADLSMIGFSGEDQANLVGWRDHATAGPSGVLGSYTFEAAALDRYAAYVEAGGGGGAVSAPSTGSRTDQRFVSRQMLLHFQRATGMDQDLLQYLGTHTCAPEAPSFCPEPGRPRNTAARLKTDGAASFDKTLGIAYGGNDSYDPQGKLQDEINPFLAAAQSATGDLVFPSRFPLERLKLLGQAEALLREGDAIPEDLEEKIHAFFGLCWNATELRWHYTSPDGTTAVSAILRPDQISGGRAADFFETLKAAIECGSLGKQHGGNDGQGSPTRFTGKDAARDGYIDLQILAIGANLIDQYDEDSYPTRIYSEGATGGPPAYQTCGVENLPYLYGAMTAWYRLGQIGPDDIAPDKLPPPVPPGANALPYESAVLIQPVIWNPHVPDGRSHPPGVPTGFQVQMGRMGTLFNDAGGDPLLLDRPMVKSAWWDNAVNGDGLLKPVTSYPAAGGDFSYPAVTVSPATHWVRFESAATTFSEPARLQALDYPAGSHASADPAGQLDLSGRPEELNEVGASATAIGFYAGMAWTGPVGSIHPSPGKDAGTLGSHALSIGTVGGGNPSMRLQYRNPYPSGPAYLTYDVIDCLGVNSVRYSTVDADEAVPDVPLNRGFRALFRADPRTARWGVASMNVSPAHWVGEEPAGILVPPNHGETQVPIYYYPQGRTLGPDGITDSGVSYRLDGDRQGSVPKSGGWRFFGGNIARQNLADLSANIRSGLQTSAVIGNKFFYTDPDGVLRRADGGDYRAATGDGLPLRAGNFPSRPVILNRPFRSVAEMGYAFRGVAWKSLNFFSPESGDAALLDAFCLHEPEAVAPGTMPLVSGRVNLNTRQPKILAALIHGVSKAEGGQVGKDEAVKAAEALVRWSADTTTAIGGVPSRGPLRNRAELVGRFVSPTGAEITTGLNRYDVPNLDGALAYSGYSAMLDGNVFSDAENVAIKRQRESVIRALADAGEVRTWNLLVDLVVQTGMYRRNSGALRDFIVKGERRVWVHLALDRITGEVLSRQVEVVSD